MKTNTIRSLHIITIAISVVAGSTMHCIADQTDQASKTQAVSGAASSVKAFKTLNFGDNTKTVESKLADIVGGSISLETGSPVPIQNSQMVQGSIFDTVAEFESQPMEFDSLVNYLSEKVGVEEISCKNSAISVNCYQINKSWNTDRDGDLSIVEVLYLNSDSEKLADGFKQSYPNAKDEKRIAKIESEIFPGVFLQYEREYLSEINVDRRARLSIPTGKFSFAFTDLSQLPKEKLAIWETLMHQDGKTSQVKEYFESVKAFLLKFQKDMEMKKAIDDAQLDSLGWPGKYQHGSHASYNSIIYSNTSAVFASKPILDARLNDYRDKVGSNQQMEKNKMKKDADSATGF